MADDVLDVINYINAKGSGLVSEIAANAKPYCDVNGDNNVAADDVLDVINYINAGNGGEGKAVLLLILLLNNSPGMDEMLGLLAMDVATQSPRRRKG